MTLRPLRTVLWQRHDGAGSEFFELWQDGQGWQLRGTIVAVLAGAPVKVRYAVLCDEAWNTREVHLGMGAGSRERALHLTVRDGQWHDRHAPLPDLDGCIDIDLGLTPSANTLAIRRLPLSEGQSAHTIAAWVRFPDLTIEPLQQEYTRIEPDTYRYRSTHGYETDFTVDDLGLVVTYRNAWSRAASRNLADPLP